MREEEEGGKEKVKKKPMKTLAKECSGRKVAERKVTWLGRRNLQEGGSIDVFP